MDVVRFLLRYLQADVRDGIKLQQGPRVPRSGFHPARPTRSQPALQFSGMSAFGPDIANEIMTVEQTK